MLSSKELLQLINQLLEGDEKKWMEFMKMFHPLIFGTISKFIPMDEVEDTTQQVYLSLIEKEYSLLKKFPSDSFPAFIIFLQRVSKNIAMRSRSKIVKIKSKNSQLNDKHNEIHDTRFHIEIQFVSQIELEDIHKEMDNWKPIYKEVILYKLNGYKNREIAEILGIPEKTVQTRLGRAREKLKKSGSFEGLL